MAYIEDPYRSVPQPPKAEHKCAYELTFSSGGWLVWVCPSCKKQEKDEYQWDSQKQLRYQLIMLVSEITQLLRQHKEKSE